MDSSGLMSSPRLSRPTYWGQRDEILRDMPCVCVCAFVLTAAVLFRGSSFAKRKRPQNASTRTCFCILTCAFFSLFFFFWARGLTHFFALRLPGVYLGGGVEPCVKNIPTVNYECAGLRARAPPCACLLYDGKLWISRSCCCCRGNGSNASSGTRGRRGKMCQWWRAFKK